MDLVERVFSPDTLYKDTMIYTNRNVLTSLLTPFMCGFGKLVMFTYLLVRIIIKKKTWQYTNSCLIKERPKNLKLETMVALDFIITIKSMKSKAFINYNPTQDNNIVTATKLLEVCDKQTIILAAKSRLK